VLLDRYTVTHWPADAGQVTINKIRARLEQEGFRPSRFDMVPGDFYGDHAHPDDEIRWVVSGRMRVRIAPGVDEIILEPGDRLDLRANVVHSADVVGDEVVVTLCASR
jgi:quercetin dioxygenase-like cupin family protein